MNEPSTRSPALNRATSRPVSSTTPMNSCPSTAPGVMPGIRPLSTWRSLPQMAVVVMRTSASPAASSPGFGTSASSTLPKSLKTSARIRFLLDDSPGAAQARRLLLPFFLGRAPLNDAVAELILDLAGAFRVAPQPEGDSPEVAGLRRLRLRVEIRAQRSVDSEVERATVGGQARRQGGVDDDAVRRRFRCLAAEEPAQERHVCQS